MRRCAVSALIALLVVAAGCDAHVPSIKQVRRLEVPRHWVGGFDVHGNASGTAESPTDILDGTLALDGRFALVLQHEILPRLAPVYTTFTVSMALYLSKDPTELEGYPGGADQFRGIFWKGRGNQDRTPSAWLTPRTNRVTFRASTTGAREVWGTTKRSIPVRRWTHIAFTLGPDRLMKLYVDGQLDSAVETVGIPVANDGPMYVGKDMTQPGIVGFVHGVSMHAHALREEDVYQQSRWSLRSVPDFDDEPETEASLLAGEVALGIENAARETFMELMDNNNTEMETTKTETTEGNEGKGENTGKNPDAKVESEEPTELKAGSHAPADPNEAAGKYAGDQFELAERIMAASLALPDDDGEAQRVARAGLAAARAAYRRSAVAGNSTARFILSTMYDAGYGSVDGRREPKRAVYHRLVAAAAGETGAQLAAGTELFTTSKGGGSGQSNSNKVGHHGARNPTATCPVALYYLFHAATRAYEDLAKPGGQSRVERLKLFEGVANQRGDHKGENDDRIAYLRQAAELGETRAMIAMGNAHYWGNFGVPRDLERALRYYERAHNHGVLSGTVGVAKMSLKGEGMSKNATKAMEYYHAAANRNSPDALNGLGYLHFYGDEVEKNLTTALSYFKRAAELGSGDGLVNAGLMVRGGMGCARNVSEAYGYFIRCAAPPMAHQSCQYNAAMIEAAGEPELGIPRDCEMAVARMRQVAEVGRWMSPMADGLKAHLAGEHAAARWLYDHAATMGVAQAKYNAAFLHEARARNVRVGYEAVYGKIHGALDGDVDALDDESDGWAAVLKKERERERRMDAAAASVREHLEIGGDDLSLSPVDGADPMKTSGALSATMLRHYSARIGLDPVSDPIDLAWAATHRGDCAYFGPLRPGGCEVTDHAVALREYVEAGRTARAAFDAGNAADAGPLLARAVYSEAWMRARGEGCGGADRAKARRLLREGLAKGGWVSHLALTPPYVGMVLSDNLPGMVTGFLDFFSSSGVLSGENRMGGSLLRRALDEFGGGTMRVVNTIEGVPDVVYPGWRIYYPAMYAFFVYTVGMLGGWHYLVRPATRFLFGLELAPLPFMFWGHGQRMLLADGRWVPDRGYMGRLRERVRRNLIRNMEQARLRDEARVSAERTREGDEGEREELVERSVPESVVPPVGDVANGEAPGAEEREELPPEEDVGEDRSYSPFEPID